MRQALLAAGLVIVAIAIFLLWRAIREPVVVAPVERAPVETPPPAPTPTPAPAPIAPAVPAPPLPAPGDAPHTPAYDERVAAVDAIRRSGDAYEPWSNDGRRVIADLIVPGARASDIGCYIAGCVGVVTFDTDAAAALAVANLESSQAWQAWTGGKKITTPDIAPDGHTTVAIVLSRPD